MMLHEVGKDKGHRARDASHAMHQNIGLFERICNEIDRLIEIFRQIESFVVFARHVQVEGNLGFRVF